MRLNEFREQPPCAECTTERTAWCHAGCERYAGWVARKEAAVTAAVEKAKEEARPRDYTIESGIRRRRRAGIK